MHKTIKIVVIDDEPMVVKGLSEIVPWHEIGCEVVGTAEDGKEGLALLEKLQPDIVISDIQMPKLSGLEMIRAMNAVKHDIKFIIMTGFRQFEYAKEAIDLGVAKFLLKPTNIDQIKEAVVEVISDIESIAALEEDVKLLKKRLAGYEALSEDQAVVEEGSTGYLAKQALQYIKEHYYEKIELKSIADHLMISTWYVCKIFKQEFGSNFVDLLNEVRIQEAKNLLAHSNLKVYEICEEVGYTDTSYFTKIFKKYANATPNKYRNDHFSM